MKFLIKPFVNPLCNKDNNSVSITNYLEKISISCLKIRNLNNLSLVLSGKKNLDFQKVHSNVGPFNSLNNIDSYGIIIHSLNLEYLEISLIKKKIGKSYPLKQFSLNISISKIEQLGRSYFSLMFIRYQKNYRELRFSIKLVFPLLISTNLIVLSHLEYRAILSTRYKQRVDECSRRDPKKNIEITTFRFHNFYQIFFLEKMILKIRELDFRFLSNFFNIPNDIFFFLIPLPSVYYIRSKVRKIFKNNSDKIPIIVEFKKIGKKSFKLAHVFWFENPSETIVNNNNPSPKLKSIISTPVYLFLKEISQETFIYSNNNLEDLTLTSFSDRISCSILISSPDISKINRILKNISFKKVDLKIYHLESNQRLDFNNLIGFIGDFKKDNQRIILASGMPPESQYLNFIYSVVILPKIQCLKIFFGMKQFSKKIGKNFFIKKCLEKRFIFFPISFLNHSYISYFNFHMTPFKITVNFNYQKQFLKPLWFVEDLVYLSKNNLSTEFKTSVNYFNFTQKIIVKKSQNKVLWLIFYYSYVLDFKETLLLRKLFIKKKKRAIPYPIFLFLVYV